MQIHFSRKASDIYRWQWIANHMSDNIQFYFLIGVPTLGLWFRIKIMFKCSPSILTSQNIEPQPLDTTRVKTIFDTEYSRTKNETWVFNIFQEHYILCLITYHINLFDSPPIYNRHIGGISALPGHSWRYFVLVMGVS